MRKKDKGEMIQKEEIIIYQEEDDEDEEVDVEMLNSEDEDMDSSKGGNVIEIESQELEPEEESEDGTQEEDLEEFIEVPPIFANASSQTADYQDSLLNVPPPITQPSRRRNQNRVPALEDLPGINSPFYSSPPPLTRHIGRLGQRQVRRRPPVLFRLSPRQGGHRATRGRIRV